MILEVSPGKRVSIRSNSDKSKSVWKLIERNKKYIGINELNIYRGLNKFEWVSTKTRRFYRIQNFKFLHEKEKAYSSNFNLVNVKTQEDLITELSKSLSVIAKLNPYANLPYLKDAVLYELNSTKVNNTKIFHIDVKEVSKQIKITEPKTTERDWEFAERNFIPPAKESFYILLSKERSLFKWITRANDIIYNVANRNLLLDLKTLRYVLDKETVELLKKIYMLKYGTISKIAIVEIESIRIYMKENKNVSNKELYRLFDCTPRMVRCAKRRLNKAEKQKLKRWENKFINIITELEERTQYLVQQCL